MTDRLRRLDSLFAEKVLGRTVAEQAVIGPLGETMRYLSSDSTYENDPFSTILPPYTRSLDAAWEGAVIVAKRLTMLPGDDHVIRVTVATFEDGETVVEFLENTPTGGVIFDGSASHPAEALVLACLRAVGCTEEELA